jgi:hypothetical protein
MSVEAGYTITAGDLIDAYFASAATIKSAGLNGNNQPMWDVTFDGITLCIIETI